MNRRLIHPHDLEKTLKIYSVGECLNQTFRYIFCAENRLYQYPRDILLFVCDIGWLQSLYSALGDSREYEGEISRRETSYNI